MPIAERNGDRDQISRMQALLREANTRVLDVRLGMGEDGEIEVRCECGHDECTAPITLELTEYQSVMRFPNRYLVKSGHEVPNLERVITSDTTFTVVEVLA